VTVTAVDPDAGDVVSYAWTATGGTFLSGAATASAVWVAPSTGGTFVLRITVTDQRGGTAAAELTITVPIGTVNVFASLNAAPFITSISNTPVFDAANPTPPATSVTLTVVASDDSGLPLTFAWASDAVGGCGGTFTDSTAATTSFLPSVTDPVGAVCTAIVTVTDGTGLFSTGTVTFGVDLPASDFPPRLVLAQQSALRVASGATVQFTAQFFDPNAGVDLAPTFTSTAPAGALPLTGPAGAGASSVTFTFPDCSGGPFDYVITATATVNGAVGPISAAKSFTVTCQP
jgi:hypothetical protein